MIYAFFIVRKRLPDTQTVSRDFYKKLRNGLWFVSSSIMMVLSGLFFTKKYERIGILKSSKNVESFWYF